ncbi:MAG: hypothetical protein LBS56_01030 [Propionibacteriaceae bacterium]|jgi:hypothetical protein|nr:hypothetical protein [Propionibacteriaceae bacterium]
MELPSVIPATTRDTLDVAMLATYLTKSSRTRPVVVLTVPHGSARPLVSADALMALGGGRADVVTVPTDDLTWKLAELLGREAAVFGGACRVYPGGDAWVRHPHSVPLRLTRTPDERQALEPALRQDLRAALAPEAPRSAPRGDAPAARAGPGAPRPAPRADITAIRAGPVPKPAPPAQAAVPSSSAVPAFASSPGQVTLVEHDDAAVRLAAHILSAQRATPVVVVSRATGWAQAFPDTSTLARDLAGIADVVELANPGVAWTLSKRLPDNCHTYGGASRVYPPGADWLERPSGLPIVLAYSPHDRNEATRQLTSEAMRWATLTQSHTCPATAAPSAPVSGVVDGISGGAAWVRLPDRTMAVVWPELVEADVRPENLFRRGQSVDGPMDAETRRLDVRHLKRSPADALAEYRADMTVPVRVASVGPASCDVELYPGVVVPVAPEDVADVRDLRLVLTVGEAVLARIVHRDDVHGEWLLSIREADELSAAQPATSLLPGGPPWLDATSHDSSDDDAGPNGAPAVDTDDAASLVPKDLDSAVATIGALHRDLVATQRQARQAASEAKMLRDQLARAKTKRREAEQEAARRRRELEDTPLGGAAKLDDPADRMDVEIRLAWMRRFTRPDRANHPLKEWSYADHFFTTFAALEGVDSAKVVDVMVEVLTGLDQRLAGRDLHQLRDGTGGDDKTRLNARGEKYWRAALQQGTPSARRLHYLARDDGSVEFSSVRAHDDYRT